MAGGSEFDDSEIRQFSRRALVLGGLQAVAFATLSWRLFDLQVLSLDHYAPLAEDNRFNTRLAAPKRGRILDINGRVLADSDEVFRATLTPAEVKDIRTLLARFRRIVPMTEDEIAKVIHRSRRQNRALPITLATDLNFEQIAKINLLAPDLVGIGTDVEWRRRYHAGAYAGQLIGFVGSLDKPSPADDPILRLPGMRVGKGGIEGAFETDLRGRGGAQKSEVDARGRTMREINKIEAVAGRDVTLAIDSELQSAVWSRLTKERIASAVVIDITSGEVRVMVSAPGFDPGDVSDGMTGPAWRKLADSDDKPLLNRAVAGQYAPGSIFKVATAFAALGAGVTTPDERINCPGHYDFGDRSFPCWNRRGHGAVSLGDALKTSCDVYFFELARRAGIEKIASTARRLGLGALTSVGLAEEKPGLVPDADWKRTAKEAAWTGGDTLLTGIGQGYVLATPIQLAVMAARIASGRAVVPKIEKGLAPLQPDGWPALDFDPLHLGAVRSGLLASVNDAAGTGANARLGDGRHAMIAGKTGSSQVSNLTSETAEDALDWAKRDHALFMAYVPADAPRYAIATVVEHGGSGATAAAPLAKDIISLLLDRDQRATNVPAPPPPNAVAGGAG